MAMPVYEYLCERCGPFTDMRPMAECDAPQDCPRCEVESPRVILTAPNFFCMPSDKRKAHATNERSANAPKTMAEYKASHRPDCGCCSTKIRDTMASRPGERDVLRSLFSHPAWWLSHHRAR
jgi:putative FmdB family regulatory protein